MWESVTLLNGTGTGVVVFDAILGLQPVTWNDFLTFELSLVELILHNINQNENKSYAGVVKLVGIFYNEKCNCCGVHQLRFKKQNIL